jgi:hypothetical protein
VDEDYARYYPLMERYVSLYVAPGSKKEVNEEEDESEQAEQIEEEGADEKSDGTGASNSAWTALLRTERPPMWKVVEEARCAGSLALQRLRDRRPEEDTAHTEPVVGKGAKAKQGKQYGDKKQAVAGPGKKVYGREPKNHGNGKPTMKVEADDSGSDGGFFEED